MFICFGLWGWNKETYEKAVVVMLGIGGMGRIKLMRLIKTYLPIIRISHPSNNPITSSFFLRKVAETYAYDVMVEC